MLEPVAADIWIAEGGIVDFYSFPYPTRAVIVALPGGGLWVWSPVALTAALEEEIRAIGEPRHLVSPNKIHHLYLQDWEAAWPAAKFWGPAETIAKRADLAFEAPLGNAPPPEWDGAIDQYCFRSCFLDEVIFFHRASRTLILADLSENFSEDFLRAHWSGWRRGLARRWKIIEGRGYAPFELRLTTRRAAARELYRTIAGWNPERVIIAHGEWQRENGRAFIEQAFAWAK